MRGQCLKNILGVCSWSLEPTCCIQLAQSVQLCSLSNIQLALDPLASQQWDLDSTLKTLEAADISICSGMMTTIGEDYSTLESIKATGGLRPDQYWEANKQHAENTARIAAELGIQAVSYHAGFIPKENSPERSVLIDRIKTIADIFGRHEVQTVLETGQERAESLLQLFESESFSNIGINFDPANMILYGMGDPAKAITQLKDHIVQVHMKDAIPTQSTGRWGEEVVAGTGAVKWEQFFQVIHTIPAEIPVLIERESGTSRVRDIVEAKSIAMQHGYTE